MKSHDKISYICHSKYATLRVLKDHYQYSNLRSDHIFWKWSDVKFSDQF